MHNVHSDVRSWPTQQLRLAYFDFTVRGEGETGVVHAVVTRWHQLGALSVLELERCFDALAWRELGRFLPGWTIPAEMPPSETANAAHGEADLVSFELWRRDRVLAKSA